MRVEKATKNGMSQGGAKRLKQTLEKHQLVFRIILGSGRLAEVKPMKTVLEKSKKPVEFKLRKYPAEQRKFQNVYIEKFVGMGSPKTCPQASGQVASHLVPKDSKSKFQATIDL